MADTYTLRNGVTKPDPGADVDTWGDILNKAADRWDEALAGVLTVAVSGDYTLTSTTDTTDQSHFAIINVVGGSGGRVLLPVKQGIYTVRNGSAANVTFLNTAATPTGNVVLQPNSISQIFNDGVSAVYEVGPGGSLKGYIDGLYANSIAYTNSAQFNALSNSPAIPGQTGNAGKYFYTNGSSASWRAVQTSDIAGLNQTLANTAAAALAFAIIF